MLDRAHQYLAKLALEPEWEARFEANSYGFRPGRSVHDAIEAIFLIICKQPKYVLDANIANCFNAINHLALLNKLQTFLVMRRTIKAWLKAGVLDEYTGPRNLDRERVRNKIYSSMMRKQYTSA